MSYTHLVYHIVFRTHRSILAIDEQHERELYAYIHGYIMRHKAKLYRIGGMPDHIQLLDANFNPRTNSDTAIVGGIDTSKWM